MSNHKIIMLAALLLVGCNLGPSVVDVDYYVGREGLVLDWVSEESIRSVFEDSQISVNFVLHNNGAYDVIGDEHAIFALNFDPYYFEATEMQSDAVEVGTGKIVMKGIQLPGRSRYYPAGKQLFLMFPNVKVKKIEGQRERPTSQLSAYVCYPYQTTMSKLVCVDFNVYGINQRDQVCTQSDLSLSDQGAPVAVTRVEVSNQPAGNNLVRPVYVVHVTNVGDGTVLSPVDTETALEQACTSAQLTSQDFNTVDIQAILSDDVELECNPKTIRLYQGDGQARCMVKDEDLEDALAFRQNFESPLTVKLKYVYLSTLTKTVEIKRTNFYPGSSQTTQECMAWEVRTGDGCESRCSYCAANPQDGSCQPKNLDVTVDFNSQFSCSCSSKTCNDILYAKGLCVPNSGYCPPASYCCASPCKSSEVRLEDGKCYLKCSTTTCSTRIDKDCACGTTDQYVISRPGEFCCAKRQAVYATQPECKEGCV